MSEVFEMPTTARPQDCMMTVSHGVWPNHGVLMVTRYDGKVFVDWPEVERAAQSEGHEIQQEIARIALAIRDGTALPMETEHASMNFGKPEEPKQ